MDARILLLTAISLVACTQQSVCDEGRCNTGDPSGPVHGVRSDGRVDVTASQAWPARNVEPAALTGAELARACVALGSCLTPKDDPATLIGLCTLPDGAEERAVPSGTLAERRSFVLRSALAGGACPTLNALETPRPREITCEEDGCWWSGGSVSVPKVSCAGDVATLTIEDGRTVTRDCARSWQRCDAGSATGCTDRHPVACDPAGKDRCDGHVKLGCDHQGRVSFHDCARVAGGTCEEDAGGAHCVYPDAKSCTAGAASTCSTDGKVSVCVAGEAQLVDCTALGFARCDAGRCVL